MLNCQSPSHSFRRGRQLQATVGRYTAALGLIYLFTNTYPERHTMNNLEDVKKHIANHKRKYIIAGAVAGVAAIGVGGYILGTKSVPQNVENLTSVKPKIQQIMNWKPTATLEVTVECLGDPGNIIQDVTTGTIYASQNQAAKALGVYPARISEHLAGKLPNVQGHELVNLGKAHVLGAK